MAGCRVRPWKPHLLSSRSEHDLYRGLRDRHNTGRGGTAIDACRARTVTQVLPVSPLHAGNTPAKKAAIEKFLDDRGYVNAPVTIDNQDFMFDRVYRQAIRNGQLEVARCIGTAYVAYMEEVVAFFEQRSVDVMGYEIPQVLLLHDNALNAEYFPELVDMLQRRGYRFVSLDEALRDPAYSQPEEYVGPRGLSWIHRWGLTRGMEFREEPRDPGWLREYLVQAMNRVGRALQARDPAVVPGARWTSPHKRRRDYRSPGARNHSTLGDTQE